MIQGWSQCSGGGAIYHYGIGFVNQCNFTDNAVTYGGSDIWSYGESMTVKGGIFNGGKAERAMVYSVYHSNIVNISDSVFLNSESLVFHSHGSTGGSKITAVSCYFNKVGGFETEPVPDASIVLVDCEFSNQSVWTTGVVIINGSKLGVTRSVEIISPVVDRECLWYGSHQGLTATRGRSPMNTGTNSDGEGGRSIWALVIAILGGIGVVGLVIVVIGMIVIKKKPSEIEGGIKDRMQPYTD
jgi:hypothetical protein